jgi:phosphate:Na+ symporter
MIIAFALAGLLDLSSSIYLLFGTNIGTCATAIIASFGGNLSSKRLALGNTIFNVGGTIIGVFMVPLYLNYVPLFSESIARQVANSHTIFNIVNTILILPLIPVFVKVLEKMIPGEDYKKQEVRHLDHNLLSTPHLALSAVIKELTVMLGICEEMLEKAETCAFSYNHKLKNEITFDEESVDEMQKNITNYLVEITKNELTDRQRRLVPAILHSVNDIERVGDYCENIVTLAQRTFEENLSFSGAAKEELERLFAKTKTVLKHTIKAVKYDDHKSAHITLTIEKESDELINQYKLNHILRLEAGTCVSESGLVFSDMLTDIERINGHLCNITKGILHIGKR